MNLVLNMFKHTVQMKDFHVFINYLMGPSILIYGIGFSYFHSIMAHAR